MGILSKKEDSKTEETFKLSSEELTFLLQKMRSATYTGNEFEMFYTLWVKLSDQLK